MPKNTTSTRSSFYQKWLFYFTALLLLVTTACKKEALKPNLLVGKWNVVAHRTLTTNSAGVTTVTDSIRLDTLGQTLTITADGHFTRVFSNQPAGGIVRNVISGTWSQDKSGQQLVMVEGVAPYTNTHSYLIRTLTSNKLTLSNLIIFGSASSELQVVYQR